MMFPKEDVGTQKPESKKKWILKNLLRFLLYSGCLYGIFTICGGLLNQYLRYDKTVSINIKKHAEFPAVTLCYQIPVNEKLELPNHYKRLEVIAEFYEFVKSKSIHTLKKSYDAKKEFTCEYCPEGLEDFCKSLNSLIYVGDHFINNEGIKEDFELICSLNKLPVRIMRYCKCGKNNWSCFDAENNCIGFHKLCDGHEDCIDGSDEINCLGEFVPNDRLTATTLTNFSSIYVESLVNFQAEGFCRTYMVEGCNFKNYNCISGPENFQRMFWEKVATFKYGTCHTIKPSIMESALDTTGNGVLVLKLRPLKLNKILLSKSGYRVVIHDPLVIPIPEEHGFDLPADPDLEIDISVTTSVKERYNGYDWDPCHRFDWNYNKRYTKSGCEIMCQEEHSRLNYNCYNYISDLENITQVQMEYSRCLLSDEEIGKGDGPNCDCPEPCFERFYKYSVDIKKVDKEIQNTVNKMREIFNNVNNKENIDEKAFDYNKITIHLTGTDYEYKVEGPKITLFTFLSNVGGVIGVFIGLSVAQIGNIFLDWICPFIPLK